jgi:hypothetical protein
VGFVGFAGRLKKAVVAVRRFVVLALVRLLVCFVVSWTTGRYRKCS